MSAKRPLTDQEIESLLKEGFTGKFRLRNRAMFALGISTGYRIQEILHHRVGDVIARYRVLDTIELPRRFRKGKTSGQTKRLFPFAQQALQEWVDQMYEEDEQADSYEHIKDRYLFESQKFNPHRELYDAMSPQWASQILKEAFDRCGVTGAVSTHSMRKTYASKVYDQALSQFKKGESDAQPIWVVQQALGHSNIANTMKYLSFKFMEIDKKAFNFDL